MTAVPLSHEIIYLSRSLSSQYDCRAAQLISESYNNSHNRVKITPQGGVTIFGVNLTPKRS